MERINEIEVLNEEQAAKYLGVATKTLQGWRYAAEGPKYFEPRYRVIRYKKEDVLKWLTSAQTKVDPI